jgi:hypothetical protein
VYRQNAGYRMKYINLLDELERKGMKTDEIWRLSQADNHK